MASLHVYFSRDLYCSYMYSWYMCTCTCCVHFPHLVGVVTGWWTSPTWPTHPLGEGGKCALLPNTRLHPLSKWKWNHQGMCSMLNFCLHTMKHIIPSFHTCTCTCISTLKQLRSSLVAQSFPMFHYLGVGRRGEMQRREGLLTLSRIRWHSAGMFWRANQNAVRTWISLKLPFYSQQIKMAMLLFTAVKSETLFVMLLGPRLRRPAVRRGSKCPQHL